MICCQGISGRASVFGLTILKQVTTPLGRGKAIDAELNRILKANSFAAANSPACSFSTPFPMARAGAPNQLKERTLGVELFGRDPAYDTGVDAIVRVKANEIRRRLAQHNGTAGPGQRVRIELPPGSYVPQFHWLEGAETNNAGRIPKRSPARLSSPVCARWRCWSPPRCGCAKRRPDRSRRSGVRFSIAPIRP